MTDQLPIIITVSRKLTNELPRLRRVLVKAEAQFNFQSMTADWYGDEEQILAITLKLLTAAEFENIEESNLSENTVKFLADDVRCAITNDNLGFDVQIALTNSELSLLKQHPKLTDKMCTMKLRKVINLIAKDLSLPALP